jgi:uncharacterized protein YneF (UPF0154 family)
MIKVFSCIVTIVALCLAYIAGIQRGKVIANEQWLSVLKINAPVTTIQREK